MTTDVWDACNVNASRTKQLLMNTEQNSNHEFLQEQLKNYLGVTKKQLRSHTIWKAMRKKRVERCCELAIKKTEQLYKISTPCLDVHHFKKEELATARESFNVYSRIVLKGFYLTRIGGPDILSSVNKLAKSGHKMDSSM